MYSSVITLVAIVELLGLAYMVRKMWCREGDMYTSNDELEKENAALNKKIMQDRRTIDKVRTEMINVRTKATGASIDRLINQLP